MSRQLRLAPAGVAILVAAGLAVGDHPSAAQEKERSDLVVFSGQPGVELAKAPGNRVFLPHDVLPASRAKKDVFINHRLAAKSLDAGATGTVCEMAFRLKRNQFAAVRFTPDGEPAGDNPGLDVKKALFLDSTKPSFLVVRARTVKDGTATVDFKIGGVAGETYRDGTEKNPWEFPEVNSAKLTGEWQEVVLDLKGKHMELQSVICPLTVGVDGGENNGEPVKVYIDSIKFTTKR